MVKLGTKTFCSPNSLSQPKARSARGWPSVAMPDGMVTWRGSGPGPSSSSGTRRDILFVGGETVQQVRQSLGVHQAMLDGDIQELLVCGGKSAPANPKLRMASSRCSRVRRLYFSTRAMVGQSLG